MRHPLPARVAMSLPSRSLRFSQRVEMALADSFRQHCSRLALWLPPGLALRRGPWGRPRGRRAGTSGTLVRKNRLGADPPGRREPGGSPSPRPRARLGAPWKQATGTRPPSSSHSAFVAPPTVASPLHLVDTAARRQGAWSPIRAVEKRSVPVEPATAADESIPLWTQEAWLTLESGTAAPCPSPVI